MSIRLLIRMIKAQKNLRATPIQMAHEYEIIRDAVRFSIKVHIISFPLYLSVSVCEWVRMRDFYHFPYAYKHEFCYFLGQ